MKTGSACEEGMRHQGLVNRTFNIQRKLCGHRGQTGPGFAACGSDVVTSWLAGLSFLPAEHRKQAGWAHSKCFKESRHIHETVQNRSWDQGNTAQVERPSLGLRDPGGALWGKLGLEGSMVRWAWSHPLLLLDKPAEAQKVPHFTARAVKGYRGPQNLPLCPTHVLLKAGPF